MKKVIFTLSFVLIFVFTYGQYGTTTTYQNPYGATTGTKTTTTDYFGNKKSTYKDPYGNTTQTKTTTTDYFCNKKTVTKDQYGNTI